MADFLAKGFAPVALAQRTIDATAIAREFARAIEGIPGAVELWVHVRRDAVALWLITEQLDRDGEIAFYRVEGDVMRRYPRAAIELHLINPTFFEDGYDIRDAIPMNACPVDLFQ